MSNYNGAACPKRGRALSVSSCQRVQEMQGVKPRARLMPSRTAFYLPRCRA